MCCTKVFTITERSFYHYRQAFPRNTRFYQLNTHPSIVIMAENNEAAVILEELDLHKFLYDDLVQTRPYDTIGITESLETIKNLEGKLAELLGDAPPTAPQASASSVAPEQNSVAISSQGVANETHSTASSPQDVTPSWQDGSRPALSQRPLESSPRADLFRDPAPAPHWPSSAPSPFVVSSRNQPQHNLPIPPEGSRKRPRQDSRGTLAQPQSSKRTAVSKSKSRMQDIEARMNSQLAIYREIYEDMRRPENIRQTALDENITEDQARNQVDQDEQEMEQLIKSEFQLERDGELARMLQAQEEPSDDEREVNLPPRIDRELSLGQPQSSSPVLISESRPNYTLPDRTQTQPFLAPASQHNQPQSTWASLPAMAEALRAAFNPGFNSWGSQPARSRLDQTQPYEFTKPSPSPIYPTGRPYGGDDDIQEISPAYFNSRANGPPRLKGPPPMPMPGRQLPWMQPTPAPMPDRQLPWMQDPWEGDTEAARRVMDFAQDQMEAEWDEDDLVYV